MTTALKADGNVWPYAATGNVTAGDLKTIGSAMVGVALETGVTGDTIPLGVRGIYQVTRTAAATLTAQGANAYATSTGALVATTTGNVFAGKLAKAAATADTTAYLAVNFGSETV